MTVHLLLFRPRPDLPQAAREELVDALTTALREIPAIRRVRVGPRVLLGRSYESLMTKNYPFAALLEFDDTAGLEAYLAHPAHDRLAAQFFASFEEALIYDFEMLEGEPGIAALRAG
jgi:hypothetical protein